MNKSKQICESISKLSLMTEAARPDKEFVRYCNNILHIVKKSGYRNSVRPSYSRDKQGLHYDNHLTLDFMDGEDSFHKYMTHADNLAKSLGLSQVLYQTDAVYEGYFGKNLVKLQFSHVNITFPEINSGLTGYLDLRITKPRK